MDHEQREPSFDSPWVRPGPSQWEHLARFGQRKIVPAGALIYAQGEASPGLYYLHRGRIKVGIFSASGAEKILAIHDAPATFGETAALDGKPFFATATALECSEIYLLPPANLRRLVASEPETVFLLFQSIVRKMRLLALQVEDLAFLDSTARIAHMLTKLANDYGVRTARGIEVALPITHQELADVTGISRVTVTTILNRLAREGVLSKQRRRLVIHDEERLQAILCTSLADPGKGEVGGGRPSPRRKDISPA